jgi:RimJ/RimL family protein N-acetyltransferase
VYRRQDRARREPTATGCLIDLPAPALDIETPRLRLRLFREEDLDAYAEMCADPEVMRYIGDRKVMTRSEAWRHMAMMLGHHQLRGYGLCAVEEKASGEMVGRVGIWRPDGWPELEAAWTLRRRYWGKGYATEAARAAIDYAFRALEAERVISLIDEANTASIRVAERLGERPLEGMIEIYGRPVQVYSIRR